MQTLLNETPPLSSLLVRRHRLVLKLQKYSLIYYGHREGQAAPCWHILFTHNISRRMQRLEPAGWRPRRGPAGRFMKVAKDAGWCEEAESLWQLMWNLKSSVCNLNRTEVWWYRRQPLHFLVYCISLSSLSPPASELHKQIMRQPLFAGCVVFMLPHCPSVQGRVCPSLEGDAVFQAELFWNKMPGADGCAVKTFWYIEFSRHLVEFTEFCSEATEIGLQTLSDWQNICFSLGKTAN